MVLGQIIESSNRPRSETILLVVYDKFQFDRACFQTGEASANFHVNNSVTASPSQTQRNNAVNKETCSGGTLLKCHFVSAASVRANEK